MQPLVLRAPAPRSGGASPRIRTRIVPGWVLPNRERERRSWPFPESAEPLTAPVVPHSLCSPTGERGRCSGIPWGCRGRAMPCAGRSRGTELGSAQIWLW